SASNDNSILLSLNAQLRMRSVDLCLNTTRQYLNLVQKGHTKMGVSSLLAKSLGKGPWHARCIHVWANQWKNSKELYLEENKFKLAIPEFISHMAKITWMKIPNPFKKIYFDGHEREDVVKSRNHFLQKMAELRKQIALYEGVGLNRIPLELYPEIVLVAQDETTLYSNDSVKKYWSPWNKYSLRKKSLVRIRISLHSL
ncbi:24869_t:CDS:2, partial [Dentiscutata erythropus]